MYPRHTALPSPSLHPTMFQKLRFKLARANAIVYNACLWHRRRLAFITRIRGKRVLSGLPPLKKLSAGQNSVMFRGVRLDRLSSQSYHTHLELARPITTQSVQRPLEATVPHIRNTSEPGQSYSQGANETVERSRSCSSPPVESRRWEYSRAWLDGTTVYQHKRREVKRKRDHEQQQEFLPVARQHPPNHIHAPIPTYLPSLNSRGHPRHARDPWKLDLIDSRHNMSVGKKVLEQESIYRSSAPSPSPRSDDVLSRHRPSSPSPRHIPPTSEHVRPFRPFEAGHSAPVVRTFVKEHTSTHTSRSQAYCHKHSRTRDASRTFAQRLLQKSSADSRVSSRARRHRRSRKHTPEKSSARFSRHALSCPIPRTPQNVRASFPYIPSRSSHTSVPWYATPPLSVGRERWSSVTAEETLGVMQSSRRADASRKRPLDEGLVHSGDSIDAPARKKLRATPRSARQY